jgi:hypothetical protein
MRLGKGVKMVETLVNNLDSHGGKVGNAANHPKPMKTPPTKLLASLLFVATCAQLQARFVTLTVNDNPAAGPTNLFAQLTIQSNEVATVHWLGGGYSRFFVVKDGRSVQISSVNPEPVIAGPAVFQFQPGQGGGTSFLTIEISPESFPPDKTLIIPQGTGANITFECSTNLLDWNPVWQGTYTNAPSSKFFRISADRLP